MTIINQVRVSNMTSRNGNTVPNQFVIDTPDGKYFQSYDSVIVFKAKGGKLFLDENKWDYSVTTGKYRNQFLGENKADTQKKINSGDYKLANLNI